MQSAYPPAFEREMGCTEAEWLRTLPAAIGPRAWRRDGATASAQIGGGTLHLAWRAGAPRTIGRVRLPRLQVRFRFEDVGPDERLAFMRRFDLYMQRGGG
ncbi:hypothetical protein [Ramlibacter sp.]|uniref:hypothetical protein n=1 Tax=Ramlibacter sp. TaxID=1917967 RepID=UPI002CFBA72E|nr:hypothetical protein [Ramlibacter sp.]HWI83460.1 hypothetical protein [Ramlibacter sp.]